ncbi:MAG TPA: helix-turn-helix domain-containing protein [Streptosporangiaceae bacterium]
MRPRRHDSSRSGSRDDKAAFARDLRALRRGAGLDHAELAARAHYPEDTVRAAEAGPALPTLPVLEAYVRGCGARPAAWEDRWRRLMPGATATGSLPVRDTAALATPIPPAPTAVEPTAPALPGPRAPAVVQTATRTVGTASLGGPRPAVVVATAETVRSRGWTGRPAGRRAAALLAAAAAVTGGALALAQPGGPPPHHVPLGAAPRTPRPAASGPAAVVPTVSAPPSPHRTRPARPAGAASPPPAPSTPPAQNGASLTGTSGLPQVAGTGCPDNQGDGFSLAGGPPGPGWADAGGGWTGNGCDGAAVWTHATPGGPGTANSFTWNFSPAGGVSHCTLAVFIPGANADGVAVYTVYAGTLAPGSGEGTVSVDQAANAGQWAALGSYPVAGGPVFVQLTPAAPVPGPPGHGGPGGPGRAGHGPGDNSAIAASAASAVCS